MFQSMEKQVWTPQGEIFDESRQPFPPLDLPDFVKQADRREKLKKTGLSEKIKCTSRFQLSYASCDCMELRVIAFAWTKQHDKVPDYRWLMITL